MQIAFSRTREQFPLSERKVAKKTLAGTLGLAIALLLILIVTGFVLKTSGESSGRVLGIAILVAFIILACVALVTYLYQKWYFAFYYYDLNDSFIVIRKAPITPREISIPYERVQDVYVDQDLLDRFFGLYDVHLSSATVTSGMEAHIDGVEKPAADGLRKMLLETVQKRISKNRNQTGVAPEGGARG